MNITYIAIIIYIGDDKRKWGTKLVHTMQETEALAAVLVTMLGSMRIPYDIEIGYTTLDSNAVPLPHRRWTGENK